MKEITIVNKDNQTVGYMVLNNGYHDLVFKKISSTNGRVIFSVPSSVKITDNPTKELMIVEF